MTRRVEAVEVAIEGVEELKHLVGRRILQQDRQRLATEGRPRVGRVVCRQRIEQGDPEVGEVAGRVDDRGPDGGVGAGRRLDPCSRVAGEPLGGVGDEKRRSRGVVDGGPPPVQPPGGRPLEGDDERRRPGRRRRGADTLVGVDRRGRVGQVERADGASGSDVITSSKVPDRDS